MPEIQSFKRRIISFRMRLRGFLVRFSHFAQNDLADYREWDINEKP
jgi:hypothetical protein